MHHLQKRHQCYLLMFEANSKKCLKDMWPKNYFESKWALFILLPNGQVKVSHQCERQWKKEAEDAGIIELQGEKSHDVAVVSLKIAERDEAERHQKGQGHLMGISLETK